MPRLSAPRAALDARLLASTCLSSEVADALVSDEIVTRRGMRITAPLRTNLDVTDAGTTPEHVIIAVGQAWSHGLLISECLRQVARGHDRRVRTLIGRALK